MTGAIAARTTITSGCGISRRCPMSPWKCSRVERDPTLAAPVRRSAAALEHDAEPDRRAGCRRGVGSAYRRFAATGAADAAGRPHAAIDLGTGGGFPGLVLAIATGVPFDLIESDRRKASFLRTAVLETGAPATVIAAGSRTPPWRRRSW